jgi:hypothetical protein
VRARIESTRFLRALPAALLLAAALVPGIGTAAPPEAFTTEEVSLQSNVADLYPRRAEICLTTYQQLNDAPGVVLWLRADIANFSCYQYTVARDSLPRGAPVESRTGSITVSFDRDNPRPQRVVTVIQAVSRSGWKSRPYSIEIRYQPGEVYAAAGQRRQSWLVVHASDLALCGGSVEEWIVEASTAQDRAYARKRWSHMVSALPSEYDKARAIAHDLIRTLRPHDGVPSAAMQYAPGFEQLARAESGQDHVWCANYADIFSAACNALDIPVRKINMQYVWSSRGKTAFEIGEGHRTTEVFDRTLNRWIWMDLTFGCLGARLGDLEPLDMADLVHALHHPDRRERLRIVEYDDKADAEKVVTMAEARSGEDLRRFFRQDQRYRYVRRARPAGPQASGGER